MNHCNPLSTIGDADGLQEMPHQWTTLELVLTYLRHPNIVKLIGYCLEGAVARLPLDTRVKMALGIARGLVFLHSTQDKSASDWSWIQKTCHKSRLAKHVASGIYQMFLIPFSASHFSFKSYTPGRKHVVEAWDQ
ncbi:probable receptor-like protein kinase isoform X1 [Tanacetum coccineum]